MRVLLVLLFTLAGCARSEAKTRRIEVIEPSARLLPSGTGALYLRVENRSGIDDRLIAVESDAFAEAELHESRLEGDLARMTPSPDGFPIGAGQSLVLAPGGKHAMLYGVTVAKGASQLPLTLRFARAPPIPVVAKVLTNGIGR